MKLFVTEADIRKQVAQCKLFLDAGNVDVAKDCKNVLRDYWNQLNAGLVDVADIDLLYRKLKVCTGMITEFQAYQFNVRRNNA